jgi:hypothetical protein
MSNICYDTDVYIDHIYAFYDHWTYRGVERYLATTTQATESPLFLPWPLPERLSLHSISKWINTSKTSIMYGVSLFVLTHSEGHLLLHHIVVSWLISECQWFLSWGNPLYSHIDSPNMIVFVLSTCVPVLCQMTMNINVGSNCRYYCVLLEV